MNDDLRRRVARLRSVLRRSPDNPGRTGRLLVTAAAALLGAWFVIRFDAQVHPIPADFDPNWRAARVFWSGGDPYAVTGPGLPNDWPWPLFYPATTLTLLGPFMLVSLPIARVLFAAISAGALAWAATRDGWQRLPLFASYAFHHATIRGQWAPLFAAAFLWPALGVVLSAKPPLGAAVWLARPSRRAIVVGTGVLVVTTLRFPGWVGGWLDALGRGQHFRAPIASAGGLLILVALLRWRRPEARFLVLLSMVPATLLPYETLPLFVVPATFIESALLAALSWASLAALVVARPNAPADPAALLTYYTSATGPLFVHLLYLPCVLMVLRRANAGPAPAWLERALTRWRVPRWLAGHTGIARTPTLGRLL